MYQLFETIKCNNGELVNMKWHNRRFNGARKMCFEQTNELDLVKIITVPPHAQTGMFRCRVTYSETIEKIEFIPHHYRKIESLKIIEENNIDYKFKYSNRELLNFLFEKRGNYDDIIIVKNGFITDSTVANLLFFDGDKWWTPDTPLLPGTQRAKLLEEKKVMECKISVSDLTQFQKAGLINAMWSFSNMPIVDIKNIK